MSGLVLNTKQQTAAARPSHAGNTKQLISRKPVAAHRVQQAGPSFYTHSY